MASNTTPATPARELQKYVRRVDAGRGMIAALDPVGEDSGKA